jgi:AraC-like DNA-binding protein
VPFPPGSTESARAAALERIDPLVYCAGFVLTYREFAPIGALAPAVARLWTLTGDLADLRETAQPVLPDGHPELVVHFGDPFERIDLDGRVERQPAVLFAGQLRHRLILRPTGAIAVLGVRLHPFGAAAFLRIPQQETAGLTLSVDLLSPALMRDLAPLRESGAGPADAVRPAQDILLRHLDAARIDPRVRGAASRLTPASACDGAFSVESVAREMGLTRRHLERRFLLQVGITPKRFARIARFSRAVQALDADAGPRRSLAAAAWGYADQAHFIREFHDLAGCAPGEHLLRRGELTGFFVSGADARG